MEDRARTLWTWIGLCAGLLGTAVKLYAPALDCGFVWLDHLEVEQGALIARDLSQALGFFLEDGNYAGYHRPIYNLLHSLDVAFFGLEPRGHHLTSILLHALNGVLFLLILRALHVPRLFAFFAAAVWLVHPVHAPTVGLIHAKADLFVVSLLQGVVLCLLGAASRKRWIGWELAAAGLFLLALLTKELAFVFPAGLTLVLWGRPQWKRTLIVLWALAVGVFALRSTGGAVELESEPLPFVERLLTFALVYVDYARNLALGYDLRLADTVTRWSAVPTGEILRSSVALVVLIATQVQVWRKRPQLRKWLTGFNLALLPVAQVIPILHFRADRFLYLPSLFLLGLLAEELSVRARGWNRSAQMGAAVGVVVLVGFATFATRARIATFENDDTLFRAELEHTPDYLEGLSALALHHDLAGRSRLAHEYYARCLAPPEGRVSYLDCGNFVVNYSSNLLKLGHTERVLEFLDAHETWTTRPAQIEEASYNRAVAWFRLERYEDALGVFAGYVARHPIDASAHYLLGRTAFELELDDQAERAFRAYLDLAPEASDSDQIESYLRAIRDRRP